VVIRGVAHHADLDRVDALLDGRVLDLVLLVHVEGDGDGSQDADDDDDDEQLDQGEAVVCCRSACLHCLPRSSEVHCTVPTSSLGNSAETRLG